MDVHPRSIFVNGTELTYVEQGTGDPVVFVHGTLGDFRSWGLQMGPFARHYRVVAYSRRRHWPNVGVAGSTEYAATVHASDLGALIDALELGPSHLVGSSYGAITALTLAVERPALVRTLVLGEPPLIPWLMSTPDGRTLNDAFQEGAWVPARNAFRTGSAEMGVRLFIDGVIGEGAFDQLPSPARAVMMDNAPEMNLELESPPEAYFPALTC